MKVTHISDVSELRELQSEWEKFLSQIPNHSIFMTWEWLVTWWEVYGKDNELWWLLIRDESGKLTASAPLYVRKLRNALSLPCRELRFIGTGAAVSPEHLDALALNDDRVQIARLFAGYLEEHSSDWDALLLTDVSEANALIFKIATFLENSHNGFFENQNPVASYIPLPFSWDEYFQSLGKNLRATIARRRRNLNREHGFAFHLWTKESGDLESAFSEFERLFSARRAMAGTDDKLKEAPGYRSFHRRLAGRFAEKGRLYLAFLKNKDKAVAVEYAFQYRNILYSYQIGMDFNFAKSNVFKVLRSYVIEDIISKGFKEFDLLRGKESYKYAWKAVPRGKHQLRYFRSSLYGKTLSRISKLRRTGKRAAEMLGLMSGRG